ncbi:PP2C family protein-serine/threonine phosphatase [Anaerosacchariphilus polymeriproducens]|nr:protein phosphatase 2C domain-containing protein [Anaerosacchariphilus polymeriproducens]
MVSASTDIGIKKSTNQDSLMVKTLKTGKGRMTFAVLCDGMGGLAKGEVASATVINAFHNWMMNQLPILCKTGFEDFEIQEQWETIIEIMNQKIMNYGNQQNIKLGTTVVAMLLTEERYYIANVGDSRIYKISDKVEILTEDQTVVAREVKNGNISQEEARIDPRRNVLLQCVGASDYVSADFLFGNTEKDVTYMLCSDGFRHEINDSEIQQFLNPEELTKVATMKQNADYLIDLNKKRQETDNISVILVRTF